MRHPLNNIVAEIQKQERKLSAETSSFIDEAYKMTVLPPRVIMYRQRGRDKRGLFQ